MRDAFWFQETLTLERKAHPVRNRQGSAWNTQRGGLSAPLTRVPGVGMLRSLPRIFHGESGLGVGTVP